MRKQLKRIRIMQSVTGCTLFLIFFIILAGTAGALELDHIGILQALFQFAIGLGLSAICTVALRILNEWEQDAIDAIERADARALRQQAKWNRYFETGRL